MWRFLTLVMACYGLSMLGPRPTASAQAPPAEAADSEPQVAPVASALTTMFSPARAPKRKTMGLLQRSFLDLASGAEREMELAIVVDGTDSMSTELAGVRQSITKMLDDLRRHRDSEVRAALVVYRDAGAPSGEVTIPLKRFTADEATIEQAVQQLRPESGAPFFHELADVGLHAALTELPWSDDPQVTRWVLVFGDAPPYAESFQDAAHPAARRRYATELLVAIAARKNIRINSVLCTSSENVSHAYQRAVDQTRGFLNELASGTDGLMLDLSYPEIRSAVLEAARQPEVQYAKIAPITGTELTAAQRIDPAEGSAVAEVRVAVVPHQPLTQTTFDPRREAVQVSTALRHRLGQLPGVRLASPVDIQRQLRRLRADGISEEQAIRGLAGRLGVDYVVWGQAEPSSPRVQTAAYRRSDGEKVVQVEFAGDHGRLANVLLTAASQGSSDEALSELIERMRNNSLEEVMQQPLASEPATSRELLAALESLEQALAYPAGSEESVQLLRSAEDSSRAAIGSEPRNALGHWLAANVAFNQAAAHYQAGRVAEAKEAMRQMQSSLRRALRERRGVESPSLITEIEGDYALLVEHDTAQAIERYKQLTARDQPLSSQLRGHWMLAGIYAGDWGVSEGTIDLQAARDHVIEILANWPESPEAEMLRSWLRWNESTEQTEFNYLPKRHVDLSNMTQT